MQLIKFIQPEDGSVFNAAINPSHVTAVESPVEVRVRLPADRSKFIEDLREMGFPEIDENIIRRVDGLILRPKYAVHLVYGGAVQMLITNADEVMELF